MLSFKQYLAEQWNDNDDDGFGITHTAKVHGHTVKTIFSGVDVNSEEGDDLPKGHYHVSFRVNGSEITKAKGVSREQGHHIMHHVMRTAKEFVRKYTPEHLEFSGEGTYNADKKASVYQKAARKLGGQVSRGVPNMTVVKFKK